MENIRFDFALLLTSLTLFTGLVWLIDRLWFEKQRYARQETTGTTRKDPGLVDVCKSFFPVIALVFVIRSFIAEPFKIPSGSMIPTLEIGDFILVNKFTYGVRLPVLNKKIIEMNDPKRGDVMVFRFPGDGDDKGKDFIKRVIGVPGDVVYYRNRQLYLNGEAVPSENTVTLAPGEGATGDDLDRLIRVVRDENLLGVKHQIQEVPMIGGVEMTAEVTVPDGQYFVMGDNRDASLDSRAWGFVPESHIVGKAFFVWFNLDTSRGWDAEFSRIGTSIK